MYQYKATLKICDQGCMIHDVYSLDGLSARKRSLFGQTPFFPGDKMPFSSSES